MTLNEISIRTNYLNEGWKAAENDVSVLLNPYAAGDERQYWAQGHKMATAWEQSMLDGDE